VPTLGNALWASKETEALDFILTEFPGLGRAGDARLHAESPTKVGFWIRLHQDALDGPAEILISYDIEGRASEFLREMFRRRIREYVRQGSDGRWHAEDSAGGKWTWDKRGGKWVSSEAPGEQEGA
jgi:hypothetical protein